MRKLLLTIFGIIAISLATNAKTKVMDKDGEPMIGAAIFDRGGTPIGIIDNTGILPDIQADRYPLIIRMLGFENTVVEHPTDTVVMAEKAFDLGEVVVQSKEHPACRVICYIRETAGLTNGIDTIRIKGQYMVDYITKIDPKAKGFPTWDDPRVLNSSIQAYATDGTAVTKSDIQLLSFYNIFGTYKYKSVDFPDEFKGKTEGSLTKTNNDTGYETRSCRLTPETYTIFTDGLAKYDNHVYSPGIFKLFGLTMDITEAWRRTSLRFNEDETYDTNDIVAQTVSLKILGRGKLFRKLFSDNKNDVDIFSYIEMFPVDITFLTREEAKELKKEKSPTYPMTIPAAAQ